jgi:multidrug efflux pump subunit AcrB
MVEWEKEVGIIPGLKSLTFEGVDTGPPGAPIEIWIQGKDMGNILAAADDLKDRLRRFEGVYQVRSDFSAGKNEICLELKPEAQALGLTVEDLARQIYSGYYGTEALRLQRGRDNIRVKVRYSSDQRSRVSDLDNVRIRTLSGHEVPLISIADFRFSPGYSTITRTDGTRRVAVTAEVDTNKTNANEIIAKLSGGYFQEIESSSPGLLIGLQGEQEEMRESMGSLYVGFPLAIAGIFIIMATLFRSYSQPFVILLNVPFGVIGGVYGHLLLGYDFSLMSTFGLVAVSGVIVNDAIVFIERVNGNLSEGRPFFESIRLAGVRRFRPILLTSITTVGGLAPLLVERSLQAQWLIPMALSLAAGVAVATIFTLTLIPVLLVILNDLRLLLHRLRHGSWPFREEVEPATRRNTDSLPDKSLQQPEYAIM